MALTFQHSGGDSVSVRKSESPRMCKNNQKQIILDKLALCIVVKHFEITMQFCV